MTKIFTQEDVLLYLYGEMLPQDVIAFEQYLAQSADLQSFYKESKETLMHLEEQELAPSPTSLDIVLEYSAQTSPFLHSF
jgi:hypothetical protein